VQTQPIAQDTADEAVTVLYRAHALRLTRLAYVMLGDRGLAEDIVREAFAGLRRRSVRLSDTAQAVFYLRTSVLSSCRTVLRRSSAARALTLVDIGEGPMSVVAAAEAAALCGAERRALMSAIRRLPARQREALVLRFCLDEPEAEIARLMRIRPGTVRSTTYRALAALGRLLAATPCPPATGRARNSGSRRGRGRRSSPPPTRSAPRTCRPRRPGRPESHRA
jgi:RNA polymerase sigma factor (sigma-70 family)